ncbi:Fe-S cluster assembly protein SufD [Methylogaea oryzae]|uniref:Fe-S cluster assembly protein SufD n=1 Tax=Methylogaea oryzae TaxID=1295382 RepID=A0A8D4VQI3_9GAMM|nr:Fe-S cluster assembly protein SufD [Methylogaea oryzae]BBL71931.1 Fe-S cluster assembly protein SufD [Methylogaea oryzae]
MAAADYVNSFESLAPSLPGQGLAWLQQLRSEALARFSAGGFPSPREEEWKYTNVAAIERKRFVPVAAAVSVSEPQGLAEWLLPDAYRMVFVDGRWQAGLSSLPVEAGGLAALLEAEPSRVESLLGGALQGESHGFIHFNTAWFSDGAVLHLPAGCKLDKPLQLLFHGATADAMAVLRNLIVLEAGAEAEIVETYTGTADAAYLTAAVNEIVLGEGAKLTLTKLQSEAAKSFHFGGNYVRQAKTSLFEHHSFAFGGLLARTEVHASLSQGCDCQLNGLFLAQGQQHLDNHLRVDHRQPDAVSRESYKGILDGRARGVFQGRVVVHEQAQHSDAAMSNRNLLLSQDAEIDTKPQLEIYADDVKCAHGVTIGQLDEESIFFLKARGLDETEARALLTFAFANERVDAVANDALRRQIRQQLVTRFAGATVERDWL